MQDGSDHPGQVLGCLEELLAKALPGDNDTHHLGQCQKVSREVAEAKGNKD